MHDTEQEFDVAPGVRRMDIALDHLIMLQAIDDVRGFFLRGTDDGAVKEKVTLIRKGIGTDRLTPIEIFEDELGIERFDAHPHFLSVTGGVELLPMASIELG